MTSSVTCSRSSMVAVSILGSLLAMKESVMVFRGLPFDGDCSPC